MLCTTTETELAKVWIPLDYKIESFSTSVFAALFVNTVLCSSFRKPCYNMMMMIHSIYMAPYVC